jgi:hypothetical protein
MAKSERIRQDLEDAMLAKFLHANLYYIISVFCFTLFLVFLVQAGIYHLAQTMDYAILFYFFSVLLFITGRLCMAKGMELYRYH